MGLGHAAMLLAIGLPLIFLKSELPAWLESGAEKAVGVVILSWPRGSSGSGRAATTGRAATATTGTATTTSARATRTTTGRSAPRRRRSGSASIHGLAGTGAVVLLLIAALPTQLEAAAALAVFAPMSILSMAACTTAFAWVLTRPVIEPLYRTVLIPALGVFGVLFGLWYVGLT